jgi:hypothetical protein
MKVVIAAIIIFLTMIFFGVQKYYEDDKIQKNDEILSEKIVEHGYLYQNGKTIEYTKKIVTMKRNEKQ